MPSKNWRCKSHRLPAQPRGARARGGHTRTTASVQYNREHDAATGLGLRLGAQPRLGARGPRNLNAYTLESTLNFLERNYAYTRLELVDRDELLSEDELEDLGVPGHHASFRVGAYTFGGARELWNTERLSLAVGSDLTFYSKPAALDALYGRSPVSWKLFLRLRPGKMKHDSHATPGATTTPAPPHRP